MGIANANVYRDLKDGHELHIGPSKKGWMVAVVNPLTAEAISSGPHRFQIDGVIDVLRKHWKEKSTLYS